MIAVFDTHRLSYKNALLQAYALDDTDFTTPLHFYDWSDDQTPYDCGTQVFTNEQGFLYRSAQSPIQCLALDQSAVVRCSLDGGTSWSIQWSIHAGSDGLTADDIRVLTWPLPGGQTGTYNPIGAADAELPEFVLKSDFDADNLWREDSLKIQATGDFTAALTNWTSVININSNSAANVITLSGTQNAGLLRAGQKVVVKVITACILQVSGTQYSCADGTTYLLFAGNTLNNLVRIDTPAGTQADNLYYNIEQTSNNQAEVLPFSNWDPDVALAVCIHSADRYAGMTLTLRAPAFIGSVGVLVVDLICDDIIAANPITLSFMGDSKQIMAPTTSGHYRAFVEYTYNYVFTTVNTRTAVGKILTVTTETV